LNNHLSPNDIVKHLYANITSKNVMQMAMYIAIRHSIEPTWFNDRDQFIYPNNQWEADYCFQLDCLVNILFHGQNKISAEYGTNHWIPFTEQELDAPDNFQSHFMSDFIRDFLKGKHTATNDQPDLFAPEATTASSVGEIAFSTEAAEVMEAGKALWHYYLHHKDGEMYGIAPDINASFYDIRLYFQGKNDKGRMNSDSSDETYTALIKDLRNKQKTLAAKIAKKVYKYGFLK
jgi:hypothetical protein